MKTDAFGIEFLNYCSSASIASPEGTPLGTVAAQILEMASAYARDGHTFLGRGDIVNGLASFTYGRGWLDAGVHMGYFNLPENIPPLPYFNEEIPEPMHDRLTEKTERYAAMLARACAVLVSAPQDGTVMYGLSRDLHITGIEMFRIGTRFNSDGKYANALAFYSYGYGWLDAGLRAGLFRIMHDRGLFTI